MYVFQKEYNFYTKFIQYFTKVHFETLTAQTLKKQLSR